MDRKNIVKMLVALFIPGIILAGCGPSSTPTQKTGPVATIAPTPTPYQYKDIVASTGSLHQPLHDDPIFTLPDDRAIIIDTGSSDRTGEAEVYDPVTGKFTVLPIHGTLHPESAVAELPDGKILLAGGELGSTSSSLHPTPEVQVLDPSSGRLTTTGPLTIPLTEATAVTLANGSVLIIGGETNREVPGLTTPFSEDDPSQFFFLGSELFDPISKTFKAGSGILDPSVFPDARPLPDGKAALIYNVGREAPNGIKINIYNPAHDKIVATTTNYDMREDDSVTVLTSGKLLLTASDFELPSNQSEFASIYDPDTGTFSSPIKMAVASNGQHPVLLSNGQVLFAGGMDASTLLTIKSIQVYDPGSGTFHALAASLHSDRSDYQAALLKDGQVLIAGGVTGNDAATTPLSSSELFE